MSAPIFEERIYEIQPGRLREYLERYERDGLPVHERHLGPLVAYFTSEIGVLNLVIQIRRYASFEDRARRRAALEADPAWAAYRAANSPLQVRQENRLLNATHFSPLQ